LAETELTVVGCSVGWNCTWLGGQGAPRRRESTYFT